MKKIQKGMIVIAIVLLIVLSIPLYFVLSVQNPFDEMHYSVKQVNTLLDLELYTKTEYWAQPGNKDSRDSTSSFYEPSNVREHEYVLVQYNDESGIIHFNYKPHTRLPGDFWIGAKYYVKTKELVLSPPEYTADEQNPKPLSLEEFLAENNITTADIQEYQHYLIYDIVLSNFLEGNKNTSRYTMDNLGNFTVVDNTFAELDGVE